MKYKLTILTPVYNRKDKIKELYKSLMKQTNKNFQWLIIDDGSTDGTNETIREFIKNNENVHIDYYFKKNGGKHTAINFSHPYITGTLVAIVDSDDELVPNAVETIIKDWEQYEDNADIGGVTYIKETLTGDGNRKLFPFDGIIGTSFEICVNKNLKGGGFEIIRTDLLKKNPFPVFDGEKYVGESFLWNSIGKKYKTVYFNKVLYKFEFQSNGLTKSGRKLRLKNPRGCMAVENSLLSGNASVKLKFKNCMLYVSNGLIANYGFCEIIKTCKSNLVVAALVPGSLLYLIWKLKYKI